MTESKSSSERRVLFFNINGNGMGHLSRCLAYARRMQDRVRPVFFSLASAIEVIHAMGFEADYFVSKFWSRSHINAWNRELAIRVGLMLEEVRPEVVVFDGTWPFHGFMDACDAFGVRRKVWSNRGLHKEDFHGVPVEAREFDLVIEPGEIGSVLEVQRAEIPGRQVRTPPVTVLRESELLDRREARESIGLGLDARYALFSLGPGNLKDIGEAARGLIGEIREYGYRVVWARAPISVHDVRLPDDVISISEYPLARLLRAFDLFVGAAGYNTCCEVLQSGVPSLLVPNERVADDQARRADMVAARARAIVSMCETAEQRAEAVSGVLTIAEAPEVRRSGLDLSGAERAADEILALL